MRDFMPVSISAAKESDFAQIQNVINDCKSFLTRERVFQWDEYYPSAETLKSDIAKGDMFVSRDDTGRIIGVIVVSDTQPEEYSAVEWKSAGKAACIHRMGVLTEFHKQGVARQLLAHAEQVAALRGCAAVRGDAYSKNADAISLATAAGYERRGEIRLTGRPMTFICFEKILPKAE